MKPKKGTKHIVWEVSAPRAGIYVRDVRDRVRAIIWDDVWDSISAIVWGNVEASILSNVERSIKDQLWNNIWDSIREHPRRRER